MPSFQTCLQIVIRKTLDFIALIVALFFPSKEGLQYLPPIRDPILMQPCVKLVEKIKAGELKSEAVVRAFINRIEEVDHLVNSVVARCFKEAIQEAQELDKKIEILLATGNLEDNLFKLPLLGIPFTGKDSIAAKGMALTAGLYERKDFIADDDSAAVRNIRNAGGILIGLTNVPELCMWFDSENNIFGRTNNPYDLSRIPGGSTGGNSACLAYAGSVVGIGSDIGGSIRMPSFFCGIFGHKTTSQVVSSEGCFPGEGPERQKFLSLGPMCRYAIDLKPFLKAMAGERIRQIPKIDEKVDFKKLQFYFDECSKEAITSPVDKDILNAIHKVVNHFSQTHGCPVKKHHFDKFKYSFEMYRHCLFASEGPSMASVMTQYRGEANLELELVKYLLGYSIHTLPVILTAIVEKYTPKSTAGSDLDFSEMRKQLNTEITELLGDDGIFLFPCHPEVAPKHKTTLLKFHNVAYTAIFNALDVTVTQCSLGLNANGVPLGVQIVAKAYNDHLTLAVAEEIERVFGGWIAPSRVEFDTVLGSI